MTVDEAYSLVVRAVETGRAAHGYLVCGDLRGECDALVGKVLRFLFPDQPEQVAQRCHPDVAWLEPEGRSRTIHVKSMREGIIGPMSATAFSGGSTPPQGLPSGRRATRRPTRGTSESGKARKRPCPGGAKNRVTRLQSKGSLRGKRSDP